jgi:uncharacterized LabA/DUF88 family protein
MAKILLLLDMPHLWNACRIQYGKYSRLNFKNLIEKSKQKKHDTVVAIAFVAVETGKNSDNLVRKLEESGISVVLRTIDKDAQVDFLGEMKLSFDEFSKDCDFVVLGSGDAKLVSIVVEANASNKKTMLIAFCNTLDKELAAEADDIRLIAKQETTTQ